ncbi:copper chaperone PCu(A)C [Arthrobacter sp. 08Y14]|uniref:copper chaperone PCu(A)C n=1 Tax=Arthrobacter sp. 08Y14 TaxID=2058885 RepID=UPI000CE40279|nr:copper chaperone PCu(A)C [Arthrobacter sp. 08Y14]
MKKLSLAAAVLAFSAAGLAGCAADTPATGSSSGAAAEQSQHLAMTGAWAKAKSTGDMTGAFGTLENSGAEDITVVAATSPAAAAVELHETAAGADGAMAMQEIEGGFVVPAGGEYVLEPGANHLMLMGLTDDLLAGETLAITLELGDGSTLEMEATAKDFAGANESYEPDDAPSENDAAHGAGHGAGHSSEEPSTDH